MPATQSLLVEDSAGALPLLDPVLASLADTYSPSLIAKDTASMVEVPALPWLTCT